MTRNIVRAHKRYNSYNGRNESLNKNLMQSNSLSSDESLYQECNRSRIGDRKILSAARQLTVQLHRSTH